MASPKGAAAIAALIALAGTGCTQRDPNTQPTYTCTPSDARTPHPCDKTEHDQQAKEDALYERLRPSTGSTSSTWKALT